jgi:AcrR family transcriptional regulator
MATPDKKQAILQTTLKLISSQGFHATPMSAIAKDAGVAAGTIYLYFENKDALIVSLYQDVQERLAQKIILPNCSNSYKADLSLLWHNILDFYRSQPEEFKFLQQYAFSPFLAVENEETQMQKRFAWTLQFIAEGISHGLLKPLPNLWVLEWLLSAAALATKLKVENAQNFFTQVWEALRA